MTSSTNAIALSLCCLLFAAVADAKPSPRERRDARRSFVEAKKLDRRGDHAEAAEAYREADELNPAPSYKLGHGRMLAEMGQLREAIDVLSECADSSPRQWAEKQARKRCQALVEELMDRLATLQIRVVSPRDAYVEITVDGEPFDPDEGSSDLDPGDHEVEAHAEGFRYFNEVVSVEEGEAAKLQIKLVPLPAEEEPEEEEEDSGGLSPVPAYVCWGIGVAGVAVGVGFGIAAVDATNVVRNDYGCEGNTCPPRAADDIAVAQNDGTISTVGFAAGGAALALGTVLYLLADDDDGDEAEGDELDDDEDVATMRVQPMVAPTFWGVSGTF